MKVLLYILVFFSFSASAQTTWTLLGAGGERRTYVRSTRLDTVITRVDSIRTALGDKGTSNFSGSYVDLTNKPSLFDGSWSSLSGKPTISGTNTGDQDLSSYATTANLALKAPLASPTFTGTVGGITAAMVGLSNVDNTSDANKPVSTATQTALNLKIGDNDEILAYQALGSSYKGQTVGYDLQGCQTSTALVDGQVKFTAVYIGKAGTITGIKVWSRVAGSYTGDNNNRIGLYSYSGGTLTLVASSANSASLWTATANTFFTIPFSGTYSAAVGMYFVGIIYNNSAQTTAPAIGTPTTALNNANMSVFDFTNSAKLYGTVTAADLPSTQAMSGVTATTVPFWVALY